MEIKDDWTNDVTNRLSNVINNGLSIGNWTILEENENLVFKYKGEVKVTIYPKGNLESSNDLICRGDLTDYSNMMMSLGKEI